MRSLQSKLKKLYEPFQSLADCTVGHYYAPNTAIPRCIWAEQQENEEGSFSADNHKEEQGIMGYVHLYTKTEFDSLMDDIQEILNNSDCAWYLSNVQYENETNLIHYTWSWEVR